MITWEFSYQNNEENLELTNIDGTDADGDGNGAVKFALDSDFQGRFSLSEDGVVTVLESLNFEERTEYRLIITAMVRFELRV